jgi:hypothetical protein
MSKHEHDNWMRWATSLTNAEISAAIDRIEWLGNRPIAVDPAALSVLASDVALHYLTQERGNRGLGAERR